MMLKLHKLSILLVAVLLSAATMVQAQNVSSVGTINPTKYTAGEEASLSIDRIPVSLEEFSSLQQEVAQTPEGAVLMEIVAMEMFIRDREIGKQCLELANTELNLPFMLRRMPDLSAPEEQSGRPYQPAVFFSGAKPENGYNPTSPYTIQVRTSKVHAYEKVQSLKGYLLYLEVYSDGFDSHWRGVEVVRQKGSEVFKVHNCPAMVTRCKELDFESPRDYEGLK